MKSRLLPVLLLAGLALLGWWGWSVLFPSPEQVIRKRLAHLAYAASVSAKESPLARLANAQTLAAFFTADVEMAVDIRGYSPQNFSGRAELLEAAAGARAALHTLKVEFVDVSVELGADRESAVAHVTAIGKIPSEKDPIPLELRMSLKKIEGDWLINRVETVKTLQ